MEGIPRPSTIPRPPRSSATRPAVQGQPSRLPTKPNFRVRESRVGVAEAGDERHGLAPEATISQVEAPEQNEGQSGDPLVARDPLVANTPTGMGESVRALKAGGLNGESITSGEKSLNVRRRPRPSLSERTIETLSQVPPSPSPRRRKSSIYPADVPRSGLSGPSSSLIDSRSERNFAPSHLPSTPRGPSPTKRRADPTTYNNSAKASPARRSVSSIVPRSLPRSSRGVYGASDLTPKVPPVPKLPPKISRKSLNYGVSSPLREHQGAASERDSRQSLFGGEENGHESGRHTISKPKYRAHTFASKSMRQRIPLDELFLRQPSDNAGGQTGRLLPAPHGSLSNRGSKVNAQPRSPALSKEHPRISKDSNESLEVSSVNASLKKSDSPKSSAALRETIAKAKEAHRMAAKVWKHESPANKKSLQASVEGQGEVSNNMVLLKRMNDGRINGRLNIAGLGLSEFPKCLKEMYNIENVDITSGEWYESVDLVRLLAANNEFEVLPSWAFPDTSLEPATDLEQGNIFGGLQSIDLHGNNLSDLPPGMKSLTRLTNINLSRNRLANTCVDVLGQIPSLQQIKLSRNSLEGALNDSIGSLVDLEVLDLQDNYITDLGLALKDLTKMRNLAVAGNRLVSIPGYLFEELSLTEIYAARNQLAGSLIPKGVTTLAALRTLDVSRNALAAISESEILNFPSLQELNVAENRLCTIPDVSGWIGLITLCAGGNKLTTTPEGLTSLPKLKTLDLSRNSIKQLDRRLGLMDNLTYLEVGNNPLRERRQLSMKTDDLKRELRDRLPTSVELASHGEEDVSNGSESTWTMKPGGVLDRSSCNLDALEESHLEPILQTTDIKSLIFHHNRLSSIPTALSLIQNTLTALDLSHNCLAADTYLPTHLSLPFLKTLDLSSNTLTTLTPLTSSLHAPLLTLLNISYNRLHSLPPLPTIYPSLTTLLASNNSIATLDIDAASGLNVLDLSENALDRLEPSLGLLAAHGLRTLLVAGNRFRVPRREVLERGTDALLGWLRGRIPVGEGEVGGVGGEGKGELGE